MKLIPFAKHGSWDTKSLMLLVLNQDPRNMISLDNMRKRTKIMDQLDEAKVDIILKDDDHKLVCEALKNFNYGIAHKDLLATIDAVLNADEPPIVMLPKKNGRDHRMAKDAPVAP